MRWLITPATTVSITNSSEVILSPLSVTSIGAVTWYSIPHFQKIVNTFSGNIWSKRKVVCFQTNEKHRLVFGESSGAYRKDILSILFNKWNLLNCSVYQNLWQFSPFLFGFIQKSGRPLRIWNSCRCHRISSIPPTPGLSQGCNCIRPCYHCRQCSCRCSS